MKNKTISRENKSHAILFWWKVWVLMDRKAVYHTLQPWFDGDARVLILGTVPSVKSRECGSYYGHPQNRFWKTLSAVFEEPCPQTVDERKAFVKRHHLALWDVLASCEIRGSEDASITAAVANDLSLICDNAPIKAIFTTGQKAKVLYDDMILPKSGRAAISLPSTSPANRRWASDQRLLDAYRVIREVVEL